MKHTPSKNINELTEATLQNITAEINNYNCIDEIFDCHLRELVDDFGEVNVLNLLDGQLLDSNFSVGFDFSNVSDELQKKDYDALFLPAHWLILKKPSNPLKRVHLLKKLKKELDVLDVSTDSREIHILFFGSEGPFANTFREVHSSINEVLGPYVQERLQRVGITDYKVKFQISKHY